MPPSAFSDCVVGIGRFLQHNLNFLHPYGIAFLCSVGAVVLRWILDPLLGDLVPLITVYGFVALAGWKAGWWPATLTALLSYPALDYLFVSPRYELVMDRQDAWGFLASTYSTGAIILVCEVLRRAQQQARSHALVVAEKQANLESKIHERREVEQTLRESEAWLAGQREALETALNSATLETSLSVLVRTATERLGEGVRTAFYLANRECTALHHVVGMPADYANAVDGFKISAESLSCGLAMHTGLPVLTSDVVKEPRWVPWLWMAEKADFRGCWSFPIQTATGKFVGTFAVYWREPREATPKDLEFAALVTQAAGVIIARQIDAEIRREAEDALRASEERLRLAMEAGNKGAWDIDLQTGSVIWDAQQYQIFGKPRDQPPITMDEFYALVHPDDVDRIKDAAARAELTGRFREEFRIIRADGAVRWITGLGATLTDQDGHPVRMVGVNYDTTERKEAQFRLERFAEELERQVTARTAELLESESRLRSLATELNLAEQRERKRLAMELHDHLQQLLVLGRLKLGAAKRFTGTAPTAAKVMKETDEVLSQAMQYTRTLVAELSPPALREYGLAAGLRWLGHYMEKYDMAVCITVPDQEVNLPEDQCTLLFQSVRELLINSAKHARAGEAAVDMTLDDGRIKIIVSDKGQGFDLAAANIGGDNACGLSSKFGLFSIRERMRALGGSFDIKSSPGEGTVATLILSLKSHGIATKMNAQNTSCVPAAHGAHSFPSPFCRQG